MVAVPTNPINRPWISAKCQKARGKAGGDVAEPQRHGSCRHRGGDAETIALPSPPAPAEHPATTSAISRLTADPAPIEPFACDPALDRAEEEKPALLIMGGGGYRSARKLAESETLDLLFSVNRSEI